MQLKIFIIYFFILAEKKDRVRVEPIKDVIAPSYTPKHNYYAIAHHRHYK